ncbi:hypothetical protein B7Y94_01085 [Candidatus Saccharibacteria bacterium 32-49-12]|nr:MAG: hypothetical protein B7Y94_01085 [Candidatus Saccharibacteria bacterium 32-49-12]
MTKQPHGIIDQSELGRKNDYLYRVSIKGLIRNPDGKVLVVKEAGRTWWDLPGGGMDHDENIKSALAREMHEEVGLIGNFTYKVIAVDNPGFLSHENVWQLRLIFEVVPETLPSEAGNDADEIHYINPSELKDSEHSAERSVFEYASISK